MSDSFRTYYIGIAPLGAVSLCQYSEEIDSETDEHLEERQNNHIIYNSI